MKDEGSMAGRAKPRRYRTFALLALACVTLVGFGGKHDNDRDRDGRHDRDKEPPFTVPRAKCGPHDKPEVALQGQVPAAMRAAGFQGFNCNLEFVGQNRGDGANWQTAQFTQKVKKHHHHHGHHHGHKHHGHDHDYERTCAYHGTASPTRSLPGRTHQGVRALDITDRKNPLHTASLTTTAMLDPWESLRVSERRQLLVADNGQNGGAGPEIDIYDISDDCRFPQLLASAPVGTGLDGGIVTSFTPRGHEGAIAPDGLTYYVGDTGNLSYHAIDISDPTKPRMIATFSMASVGLRTHGLSISADGERAYVTSPGNNVTPFDPTTPGTNGFAILDTSEVQKRKPNPQIRFVGQALFKDGRAAQHTIPVKIRGKSYVIHVDEGGSASDRAAACAAGLAPFAMPRIYEVKDETNPKLVSKLRLQTNDPANCPQVLPDLVGLGGFTYDSHYCSVDNRKEATTLACGIFNSGIRVFDIRDPYRPKEIAYYNPAGVMTASPGSNHGATNGSGGKPDWCSAQVFMDAEKGTLWTTCQDNGVLLLKFRKGVWPFPETKTPPDQHS